VARVLQSGGQALFYVYRRKGPIREFSDDHIRSVVSEMPEADAWEALKPLTRLGQALAELDVEVDVPEDIPYLGISAGRQNVQRLIYWNVAKMFWNPDYTFDENHHINFDWYHPKYAHRHTEEELRSWCAESGLSIQRLCEQESGYTIVAKRIEPQPKCNHHVALCMLRLSFCTFQSPDSDLIPCAASPAFFILTIGPLRRFC